MHAALMTLSFMAAASVFMLVVTSIRDGFESALMLASLMVLGAAVGFIVLGVLYMAVMT